MSGRPPWRGGLPESGHFAFDMSGGANRALERQLDGWGCTSMS
jgi:hypothetical protein